MPPRSSQKHLPPKKTLESRAPSNHETQSRNPSNREARYHNPSNFNPKTNENLGKKDAGAVLSSSEKRKSASKSSVTADVEKKEETVMGNAEGEEDVEEEEEEVEEEEEEEEEVEGTHEVPEPIKHRRKQKEYEVFVGGLDRDAVEGDLERAFREVGEVVEVRLVKKAFSHRNKGFAFVRFATVEQAKRAATEIKSVKVKGRICGILRNNDNETLHVRNICTSWTKDKLVEKLKAYGLENLEEVHLMDDPNNKGKNRGYAFLDFSTHMDAVAACTKLQKRDIFFGTNVRAEVAFSKSAVEPDDEVMAQVKSVFLDGLPASWDETNVFEQFKKYGEIESVQLARNMPTAKRKDFGFISFTTREAALACIDDVNGKRINEGGDKVLLKATLKRPLPKRVQVMGGRGGGFIDKGRGERGLGSYGIGHSRTSKTRESLGRKHLDRYSGLSKYPVRGDKLRMESPPLERHDNHPRRELIMKEPGPGVAWSGRRDPYLESSSSGQHTLDYQGFSTFYSRDSSHRLYDDDYGSRYEYYYEDNPVSGYDYPAYSGSKRRYSAMDDDLLVSSSLARRARMRSSPEIDAYPSHGVSSYDSEYSQILLDDYHDYERMGYSSRHGSRVLSGSSASRSYY